MNKAVKLFLASGVKGDSGFWSVDYSEIDANINTLNIGYLECYRNHIVGIDAAIEIKNAIDYNINDLICEIRSEGHYISNSHYGFSFDLPLESVEKIYDFWFDTYKNELLWKKCIKLIKFRKRASQIPYGFSNALKGETSYCSSKIDELYSFRPATSNNSTNRSSRKFMW